MNQKRLKANQTVMKSMVENPFDIASDLSKDQL
jgi:hypothetical protein